MESQPQETIAEPTENAWADLAGMVASIGCAIHCAAMPLVLAYLPALGLSWLADEGFHQTMAIVCFGLAAAAFAPGWRKHGSLVPAMWGAAGLVLLSTAAFAMEDSCACCSPEEVAAESSQPACTDEGCAVCQSCVACESSEPLEQVAPATIEQAGIFAGLTPFVTPLGGVLLVVGHLSNHRRNCRCRDCCEK